MSPAPQTPMKSRFRRAVVAAALLAAVGCGGEGSNLAPVSGRVTLDGKPFPNAYVMFQPVATKGNDNPGRGSMAVTDADGKFTLRYDGGASGAVIGKHVVRITTRQELDDKAAYEKYKDTGTPDGELIPNAKGLRTELVPREWHDGSKEFDVPPGGTTTVNFDIVTKKDKEKAGKK